MASFLSALVGSYSGAMIQKHHEERAREDAEAKAEIDNLKLAIESGKQTPEAMEAAFNRIDEIMSDYGQKKSGFSLGNLVGKFKDVQQGGGTKATTSGGSGAGKNGNGGGGSGAAVKTAASPTSLGAAGGPPARTSPYKFKTDEQISEEAVRAKIAELHAIATSYGEDILGKPWGQLSKDERTQALKFAYKSPENKMHPIVIDDGNGNPVAALQDETDNTIIGPGGQAVKDAKLWKSPKENTEDRVNLGPNGQLQVVYVKKDTHEVFDANTNEKIENPNLLPPASYLPTVSSGTTVQPNLIPDPAHPGSFIVGPAISQQESHTSQKKLPDTPPSRPGAKATSQAAASDGPPSRQAAGPKTAPAKTGPVYAPPKNVLTAYTQIATDFKTNVTNTKGELDKATKALADLQKEKRSYGKGVTGTVEQGFGFNPSMKSEVLAAMRSVSEAQTKYANAQRAQAYMDQMRQSILEGTYTVEQVQAVARSIADKGIVPASATQPASQAKEAP